MALLQSDEYFLCNKDFKLDLTLCIYGFYYFSVVMYYILTYTFIHVQKAEKY